MTGILLDSCTFIWLAWGAEELSKKAEECFATADQQVFLSAAATWEICIKHSLGRLELPKEPEELIPELRAARDILELPIDEVAAFQLRRLPQIHRDPFDRIMIAQAIAHGLTILTPDEKIREYPVRTLW